jgi:hypothetical protein
MAAWAPNRSHGIDARTTGAEAGPHADGCRSSLPGVPVRGRLLPLRHERPDRLGPEAADRPLRRRAPVATRIAAGYASARQPPGASSQRRTRTW